MKIACLTENLATFGGTQRQFLRIAENLSLQGHTVEIFTGKFNKQYALGVDKLVKINVVDCSDKHGVEYAKEFLSLCQVQLSGFDWLLVSDGSLVNVKYYLQHVKVCWICNDAPFSHKAFVYGHGFVFRVKHFIKSVLYSLRNHKRIKSLDKIIVLDSKMQKSIRTLYKKHAEIIRSGIDIVDYQVAEDSVNSVLQKYGLKKNEYILSLGIAYPYRNFEVILRCAPFINPVLKILIVAPKHYDPIYFRKIEKLAMNSKIILNSEFISDDEKNILLKNAAMFIFPNKDQTWGLAPLEASSVKTPILVSNECGVTEVLERNKTALIFNPNDHNELSKLINLLYADNELSARLKENAYYMVRSELNWTNYTHNIVNYLKANQDD